MHCSLTARVSIRGHQQDMVLLSCTFSCILNKLRKTSLVFLSLRGFTRTSRYLSWRARVSISLAHEEAQTLTMSQYLRYSEEY